MRAAGVPEESRAVGGSSQEDQKQLRRWRVERRTRGAALAERAYSDSYDGLRLRRLSGEPRGQEAGSCSRNGRDRRSGAAALLWDLGGGGGCSADGGGGEDFPGRLTYIGPPWPWLTEEIPLGLTGECPGRALSGILFNSQSKKVNTKRIRTRSRRRRERRGSRSSSLPRGVADNGGDHQQAPRLEEDEKAPETQSPQRSGSTSSEITDLSRSPII
ncbi:hypothetical protein NDU88_005772 [Pleurodeles waltl]|uniref:Uncharacterized protein n=1 Tax=Pleurodeles waltl TaxID=8319 RepID=A0AAV7SMM1_PLEWA|nr:hypothetical protein NDU88_005772 [Pleurodeles waltl]